MKMESRVKKGTAVRKGGKRTMATFDSSQIHIADRVKFCYRGQALHGVVTKKGPTYASIRCDDRRAFRVPYPHLEKVADGASVPLVSLSDHPRLQFTAGAPVRFDFRGRSLHGVLVRVNPARGHVVAEDGQEYRVPYHALQQQEAPTAQPPMSRTSTQLDDIRRLAQRLLTQHQLSHWGFQFDTATKRAGSCHYHTQVITLAYEFVKHAPAEEIHDTLLHEIAHALVGKIHHHDAVWRAKAVEIGCSGRRCHEVQFTLPRYIVRCERGCWTATAERRRQRVMCKQCRGAVCYETYTEERWQSFTPTSP